MLDGRLMAPQLIPHEVLSVEQAVSMNKSGEGPKLVSQIIPSSVGCNNLGKAVLRYSFVPRRVLV